MIDRNLVTAVGSDTQIGLAAQKREFNPILSMFENYSDVTGGKDITEDEFYEGVRSGRWQSQTKAVRCVTDLALRRIAKKKVPNVTISGRFSQHRNGNNCDKHSELICIDVKNKYNVEELRTRLKFDPYARAIFVSISGTGLAVVFRINPKKHIESFEGLRAYLLSEYKIEIDNTSDLSRVRYVTHDPNIYVNKDALVFEKYIEPELIREDELESNSATDGGDIEDVIQRIEEQEIDITGGYDQWRDLAIALADFGPSGRKYFHRISKFYPHYDFGEADKQFDYCLNWKGSGKRKITKRTFFYYAKKAGIQISRNNPATASLFSDEVYENLPTPIRDICLLVGDRRKRDVVLIGIITALSAAFSRWRFLHGSGADVKEYSPHLCSLVIGAAGSGKGLTRYGSYLTSRIAGQATHMAKHSLQKFKSDKREFERRLAEMKKNKQSLEGITEPDKPPKYCFSISVSDTTQAALVEILHDNVMGCYGHESEIDTMVDGQKREFGGFGDVIRKVVHHEPLARQRKGEGESYIVQEPRLAFMLSGTEDQLKKLIPSEQNGLFSRVWYYIIPPVFIPYKIATNQVDIIGEKCNALAKDVLEIADLWSGELLSLSFSPQQEQDLFNAMQDKKKMELKYGGEISASWLRMGLIVKRIAVTLAAFTGLEKGVIPEDCWKVAFAMLPTLKHHCIEALNIVRENIGKKKVSKEDYDLLKAAGLKEEQIAEKLGMTRKTLLARRKEWA